MRIALGVLVSIFVLVASCSDGEREEVEEWVLYDLYGILASMSERNGTLPQCASVGSQGEILHSWRMMVALQISEMGSYLGSDVDMSLPWHHDRHASIRHDPFSGNFGIEGSQYAQIVAIGDQDAAFGRDLNSLPDSLVLLVEWPNSTIPWYEPFDLDVTMFPKEPDTTMEDVIGTDFRVLFADGSVRRLSKEIPVSTFLEYVRLSTASDHSIDELEAWTR